ncbi:hypothetical protein [Desulfofustis limnaeus]|uniref:Uncharacterized protein n=1 Tax=Desulfofustis limnaeus TaxID=2740163 RepID=A0ABN6M736_9BACT|nr:hypothetical protein [Desulfofustis limnaeus]BDD88698.1 hypothetical protein DPPLL_30630 [Desulfofustis limnaeus]
MLLTDLLFYRSATVSDDASNGGKPSNTVVPPGEVGGLWPHVPRAERTAGSRKWRKEFFKNANDADELFISPMFWLDKPTPGEDWAFFQAGTMTDTQGDLVDAAQKYGCAYLKTDVLAGASSFVVTVEDAELASGNHFIFPNGPGRITDKANPTDVAGNEEFVTVSSTSVAGNDVTINLAEPLVNGYTVAAGARFMSIYQPEDDVRPSLGTITTISAAGAFDDGGYPPILDNIGTPEETFTFTFDDNAGNFTCRTAAGASVGSGNIAANFVPMNSFFSKPLFTIEPGFWTGTWVQDDTLTMPTHPAMVPLWTCRRVPPGCATLPSNVIKLVVDGEGLDE